MKIKFSQSKDLIAGLIFVFFGIAAIWLARDYPMGSARRMGPAYFPTIIGGALAMLGLIISARSFQSLSEPVRLPALRPLIMIIGAVVGFALLLKPLGLVLALLVLILISCLGGSQFRLREVAILYIVLALIAVIFFVYGLGLQFSLWPT
jgi:NADH:ubiquinone oxidoreductase subunit 2 (subunit N)